HERALTELYTLSLHDALPILTDWSSRREARYWSRRKLMCAVSGPDSACAAGRCAKRLRRRCGRSESRPRSAAGYAEKLSQVREQDRKSTRLNSSHLGISYAVF